MNVQHCDMCYTDKDVQRLSFTYDRKMDAAGSMDDEWETFDLCPKCECKVYRAIIDHFRKLNRPGHEINKMIINKIKVEMRKRTE